jgi:hypothetical protein
MAEVKNTYFITGDITLDQYMRLGDRKYSDSPKLNTGTSLVKIRGGAYLIREFLTGFVDPQSIHFGHDLKLFYRLPQQNNSYATLSPFEEDKADFWRISQQFGFGTFAGQFIYPGKVKPKYQAGCDIVIIDDGGMDFSSHINEHIWPSIESLYKRTGKRKGTELVICKKSGDLGKGELWKELLNASQGGKINLMTLVSVNDIRRQDARISSKISWEQSALDLAYELETNIRLTELKKSKYLVVTFGSSGAVFLVKQKDGSFVYRLVYDSKHLESEWEESKKGTIIGMMSCFTAALAANLDLTPDYKDCNLQDAIKWGLASIRGFFATGYINSLKGTRLPISKIKKVAGNYLQSYSSAYIPAPKKDPAYLDQKWTILLDNYKDASKFCSGSLLPMARDIVLNGLHVLNNVPSLRFRKLFTVDRNEIESLRNIKKLLEYYVVQKDFKNPLSIAVFGLPGSGKSFGVKEIAKGVLGHDVPILDFNLSQFSGSADLIGAFHQVRDEVLKGNIPVVFWDEFDSRKYEYLQYFLAPMQDGTFQEGQLTHTLGRCILVFAGATSYKMETFGIFENDKEFEKSEDFILKKGPDFISRIHGYINVLGPNPAMIQSADGEWITDENDACYPVRRALFIRQILGLKEKEHLEIDWGLLNALLNVKKYKHGARSLTNLLKNLKENSVGRRIQSSHLPGNTILNLYLDDIDDFFKCMNENQEYSENVYLIGPAIHNLWVEKAKNKNPDYIADFETLPVFIKASNIEAAMRIPMVLGKTGLKITSVSDNRKLNQIDYLKYLEEDGNKVLETMAEEEHKLWKEFYERNGWHHDPQRDDYKKIHNCLVDYKGEKLSEADKDKDRNQVRDYWVFLDKTGFGIIME